MLPTPPPTLLPPWLPCPQITPCLLPPRLPRPQVRKYFQERNIFTAEIFSVPATVAHSLGLPEARTFVAPPTRAVAEAPIVNTVVEPVEQWGYKVAY